MRRRHHARRWATAYEILTIVLLLGVIAGLLALVWAMYLM